MAKLYTDLATTTRALAKLCQQRVRADHCWLFTKQWETRMKRVLTYFLVMGVAAAAWTCPVYPWHTGPAPALAVPQPCGYDCAFTLPGADAYQVVITRSEVSRAGAHSLITTEAFAHFQAANFEQAQREVEQLIAQWQAPSQEPNLDRLAAAYDFLGVIYQRQGKMSAAVANHRAALHVLRDIPFGRSPQELMALNNLAVAHYLLGEYQEAEQRLGEILDHPGVGTKVAARARNNRGLLYQEMGQLDQGRLEFR